MSLEENCDKFIQMIKDEQYADAHVVLEHSWKELKKIDRSHSNILKGFINGATSFEIKRRGKPIESALRIWSVYLKYKPLIEQLDTKYTKKYMQCCEILEETYKKEFKS
jgi:hypothetical protein